MRNRWFLLSILVLVILFVLLGIIYFGKWQPLLSKLRLQKAEEIPVKEEQLELVDEIAISAPPPENVIYANSGAFGTVTVSNLVLETYRSDEIYVRDQKYPMIQLAFKTLSRGKSKTIIVSLIDKVYYNDFSVSSDVPQEMVAISQIDLNSKKGREAALGFIYLPQENPISPAGMNEYCNRWPWQGCWYALDYGFGTKSINPDEYLPQTLEEKDIIEVDQTRLLPTTLLIY